MNEDMFIKADKLNKLVMDILRQCVSVKNSAKYEDGATARWIEREMDEMIGKVKRYLDD